MSDNQAGDAAAIPSGDTLNPTPPKKRRGRPPASDRPISPKVEKKPEHPLQRIEQLKAELEKAQEALREFEARRASIVGRVVVAHALAHADYRKQLADLLRKEVTSKAERAIIDELLGGAA